VVAAAAADAGLEPVPFDAPAIRSLTGPDATSLRLSPLVHGTDGYFLASLRIARDK
jgi:hypothetical protein